MQSVSVCGVNGDPGRRVGRILLVAAAGLFVLRLVLSLTRTGPVLMADEGGYLGNARMLGGGLDFVMGDSPFYRAGYSILLAPVVGPSSDPGLSYDLVLVVNAALAAALVPLLYLLLTRCFEVTPALAAAGAIAGAAYPTVTSITQIALSENALFPLTVVWLLAIGMLVRAREARMVLLALAAGACGAGLWIVHGRMIVAVAVTALLLVGLAVRRRIPPAAGIAGLATLAAGLVAGSLLNDLVVDRNYDGRRVDEVGSTLDALDGVDAFLRVLRNVAGETWYLLVATFGILGLVVLLDGRASLARLRRGDLGAPGITLTALLATAAGLLVVTAVWFVDPTRPDHILYGRYIEPAVPPLVALGVVTVMRREWRAEPRVVLAVVAALTALVAILAAPLEFPGEDANRWNVASLPFVTRDLGPLVIAGAGVAAAVGGAAILWAARRTPWAACAVLLALFVPITAFTEVRLVLRGEDDVYPRAGPARSPSSSPSRTRSPTTPPTSTTWPSRSTSGFCRTPGSSCSRATRRPRRRRCSSAGARLPRTIPTCRRTSSGATRGATRSCGSRAERQALPEASQTWLVIRTRPSSPASLPTASVIAAHASSWASGGWGSSSPDRRRDLADERRELLGRLPLERHLGLLDLDVGEAPALEQPADRLGRRPRQRPGRPGRRRRDVEQVHHRRIGTAEERHRSGGPQELIAIRPPGLSKPRHPRRGPLAVGVEDDPPARDRRVEAVLGEVQSRAADSTNSMFVTPAPPARGGRTRASRPRCRWRRRCRPGPAAWAAVIEGSP